VTGLPPELVLLTLVLFVVPALFLLGPRWLVGRQSECSQDAEARANTLLRELLSKDERQHLERFGCLMIPSPGMPERIYCIPAHPGMVTVYESGSLIMRLCLMPVIPLPPSDMLLMLKLMIEGDEEQYLRTANVQPTYSPYG
jgi:hypothetical protein